MTKITRCNSTPLTYSIEIIEQLEATYKSVGVLYQPNTEENRAVITIKLIQTGSEPSTFKYTFEQVLSGLNDKKNINISVYLKNEEGKSITHQESSTFVERPFKNSSKNSFYRNK